MIPRLIRIEQLWGDSILEAAAMDHAGHKPFVFSEIGEDHAGDMQDDEAIDHPLEKGVYLFYGSVVGVEKGNVFESEAEAGEGHKDQCDIEDEIDEFHLHIMLLLEPG